MGAPASVLKLTVVFRTIDRMKFPRIKIARKLVLFTTLSLLASCGGRQNLIADPSLIVVPPESVIVEKDTPPDPIAYSRFLMGVQEEQAGKIERAIVNFMAVLKRQPEAREARTHLFRLLMRIGRVGEAFDMLGDATALRSYPPDRLFLFGRLFAWRGEASHVRSVLAGLPKTKSWDGQHLELEGVLALSERDNVRARDRLTKAFESDKRVWAGLFLGRLYESSQQWGNAEKVYKKLLSLRADFAPAHYRLALVFLQQRKQKLAGEELAGLDRNGPYGLDAMLLRIHLALDGTFTPKPLLADDVFPGTADDIAQQAFTFWIQESPLLATNLMLLARQRDPNNGVANLVLGVIARQQGQLEQALQEFVLLAAHDGPLQDDGMREWIELVASSPNAATINTQYLKAMTNPATPQWQIRLGARLANRLSQPANRVTFWQSITQVNSNPETLYQYAMQLEVSGRHHEALTICEKVLEIDPDHTESLNFVGYSWAEEGQDLGQAEAYLQKAIRQKPWAGYIFDSMAWLYFKKHAYLQAEKWIKFAVEYSSPDPLVFEHYGDILHARHQNRIAISIYQRALRLNPDPGRKTSLQKKIARLLRDDS